MNAHKKITISIPMELDILIETLIKESKKTPKPLTKSSLFVTAIYTYLEESMSLLERLNSKGGN